MSGWNYRVMRHHYRMPNGGRDTFYAIHSVYYDNEGQPSTWSVAREHPQGNSEQELAEDLKLMLLALEKPVLEYEEKDEGAPNPSP